MHMRCTMQMQTLSCLGRTILSECKFHIRYKTKFFTKLRWKVISDWLNEWSSDWMNEWEFCNIYFRRLFSARRDSTIELGFTCPLATRLEHVTDWLYFWLNNVFYGCLGCYKGGGGQNILWLTAWVTGGVISDQQKRTCFGDASNSSKTAMPRRKGPQIGSLMTEGIFDIMWVFYQPHLLQ